MKSFPTILMIAWRNIFRNKRRALLTLSILVLGSTGLLLVGGFFQNMIDGFGEVFIHSQTGHLQINAKGYYQKGVKAPLDYLIEDPAKIEALIRKNPLVNFSVPRLKLQGMVSSGDTGIAVLAIGVDPDLEKKMGNFQTNRRNAPSTNFLEGSDLDPQDRYGVVVGKGLLDALGLKVGDTVNFITTRKAGALDGAELRIRGVFQTYIKDFDDRAMKMNIQTAQEILGLPNQIHSLLLILRDTRNTQIAKAQMEEAIQGSGLNLEVLSWVEQGLYYRQSKDLVNKIYLTIQIIMCTIFFFSIANTTNMILSERMREFGTMMAIGNDRKIIFEMIVLETTILGLIGSILGLLIGTGIGHFVSIIGIPMHPPQAAGIYICSITLTSKIYLQTFAISMVSAVISSFIPGYRAAHFNIIHALGYV